MKYYYLLRPDGSRVEIPEQYLAATKRVNPTWPVHSVLDTEEVIEETPNTEQGLACPLCDFVGKNDKSLRMHRMKKH